MGQPQAHQLYGDLSLPAGLDVQPNPAVVEEFRKRAESGWKILDAHLTGNRYLAAGRMTIADISACGYLFFSDELGVDWGEYPSINDWLQRIRSEPRWKHPYQLLPGHPI